MHFYFLLAHMRGRRHGHFYSRWIVGRMLRAFVCVGYFSTLYTANVLAGMVTSWVGAVMVRFCVFGS